MEERPLFFRKPLFYSILLPLSLKNLSFFKVKLKFHCLQYSSSPVVKTFLQTWYQFTFLLGQLFLELLNTYWSPDSIPDVVKFTEMNEMFKQIIKLLDL